MNYKNAKTAPDRIKNAFDKNNFSPHLFFAGAAIENKMAVEILNNIKADYIHNAANLTKPEHITALSDWLVHLSETPAAVHNAGKHVAPEIIGAEKMPRPGRTEAGRTVHGVVVARLFIHQGYTQGNGKTSVRRGRLSLRACSSIL